MFERTIQVLPRSGIIKEIHRQASSLMDRYLQPGYVLLGARAYISLGLGKEAIYYHLDGGCLVILIHPQDGDAILVLPSNNQLMTTALALVK